jgi:hypothetical protein
MHYTILMTFRKFFILLNEMKNEWREKIIKNKVQKNLRKQKSKNIIFLFFHFQNPFTN